MSVCICNCNCKCNNVLVATSGLPDFSWFMTPKQEKMYQINTQCPTWSDNIPDVQKIFRMSIKYINLFQSENLENFPKLGFLVWKQNIWQPCSRHPPKIDSSLSWRRLIDNVSILRLVLIEQKLNSFLLGDTINKEIFTR
jgi:hypothetical protein